MNNENEVKNEETVTEVLKVQLPYTFTGNQIIFSYEGKTKIIPQSHPKYAKLMELLKNKNFDKESIEDVLELIAKKNLVPGYEIRDFNVVKVDEEGNIVKALPKELSQKLIEYSNNDLPLDSLIAFWEKLEKNPSYRSIEMLYTFLMQNSHPLFDDGCFLAYRSVTTDFKDHHTKTMDNSVGQVLTMPRNEVDDDPKSTCSKGLHVASHSYACGFGGGQMLVEVKVDPEHVVCVPYDYNQTKMRVCQFEVIGICKDERKEVVYGREMLPLIPAEEDVEFGHSRKLLGDIRDAKDDLFDKFGDNHEMLVNAIVEETGYEPTVVEQALEQLLEEDKEEECDECGEVVSECSCCGNCGKVDCECEAIHSITASANKYKEKFHGKYLISMIEKDVDEDEETIERILSEKGYL